MSLQLERVLFSCLACLQEVMISWKSATFIVGHVGNYRIWNSPFSDNAIVHFGLEDLPLLS